MKQYISDHPYSPRLERPIDWHTSGELERLLLLWKGADAALAANDLAPTRECNFPSAHRIERSHLVEGGRWLLTVNCIGGVTYYDLDAETIVGTSLIPNQMNEHVRNKILMSVDYDAQSPTLEFTLALYLSDESPGLFYDRITGFQVWSVSLLLGSSQRGIGLVATCLSTFPIRRTIESVFSLFVLGPHLTFNGFHIDFGKSHLFVVCWKHANGQSDIYPWRMLQQSRINVSFLAFW